MIFDENGITYDRYTDDTQLAICSMEYIYFARPDSNIQGVNVHTARKRMGAQLAREFKNQADIVVGVPNSSLSAAMGFAEESGLPNEMGLIKNQYVQRTFIQPTQELREQGVRMKLSAVSGVVKGKRVVMIDDSIVRGTTSRRIVKLLKEAGSGFYCLSSRYSIMGCSGILQLRLHLHARNRRHYILLPEAAW